jgi:hypothetical protein
MERPSEVWRCIRRVDSDDWIGFAALVIVFLACAWVLFVLDRPPAT